MKKPHSPTLRLRRLAAELKQARENAKFTVSQAGERLGWTASKISKIETTETKRITPGDLDKMLSLYKITDPDKREALHALARDAKERGWWTKYRDIFGAQALPDFEAEASVIRTYEAQVIPGLLQTPNYTEALLRGGRYTSPEEIKRKVEARMTRREILHRFSPARLRAVIDEAALRRVVGGPEVMREQFEHLLHMAQLPNVDIQVLPFSAGSHAALGAPFTILDFPEPFDLPVVYIETVTDGLFLEDQGEVEGHSAIFGDVQGSAMSTAQSARFITDLLKPLEGET